MKLSHVFGLKPLLCAGASLLITVGLSWSFVESTAVAYGSESAGSRHTLSAGGAQGGAPLAPFGAVVPERFATLVS